MRYVSGIIKNLYNEIRKKIKKLIKYEKGSYVFKMSKFYERNDGNYFQHNES